MVENCRRQHCQ